MGVLETATALGLNYGNLVSEDTLELQQLSNTARTKEQKNPKLIHIHSHIIYIHTLLCVQVRELQEK
jgi:hypothetical protein